MDISRGDPFRNHFYLRHNARRLEHLASLGLDLFGKSVLEVGAGVGDLTSFFLDRGCAVTSVEPRADNVERLKATFADYGYPPSVSIRVALCDVESVPRHLPEPFDVVFCYGLLYHVVDPALVLQVLADRCAGLLLLETCVSFGDAEAINPVGEEARLSNQSFHGGGCRPTRPWVFNRLKTLLPHVYVPVTQPSHEEFPLDWTGTVGPGLSRAVFIGARRPLDLPLLLDHLPAQQQRLGAPR